MYRLKKLYGNDGFDLIIDFGFISLKNILF